MVYDIRSSSNRAAGIQLWYVNNSKIYYNTVYLFGNGTGTTTNGSAALYISNSCVNVEAKNNILVNTRDESPYYASAIYDYTASNLTSDYNDLYANNYLVRIGNTNYNTLAQWQATGKDLNSVNKLINFVSATDLHLTGSSNGDVNLIGIPLANITTDIDGNTRSAFYPYKGADEASIPLPVELTSFTAQAENQKVILRWTTATELNNNGFEIQRKVAESDFATVGFVRGEGTTTNQREYSYIDRDLADGKYFYRLKQVDYNGTYEYSNEIEVDVRSLNEYALEQNYPNPFNPTTIIRFGVPERSKVVLKIYDILGSEVATLMDEEMETGWYERSFNAFSLSSGVYICRIEAAPLENQSEIFVSIKKMLLIK
jgi:hypothetical protein